MARLWHSGFELDSTAMFDVSQGGLFGTSSPAPANGTYWYQADGTGAFGVTATTTAFFRCHLYVNGAVTQRLFTLKLSGANQVIFMISGGKLAWADGASATVQNTGSISFVANRWTLVEIKVTINGTTGTVDTKIDGITDLAVTGKNTASSGGTTFNQVLLDQWSGNIWMDDLAVNDSTGSVNNTWLGEGKVIALVPNAAGDVNTLNGTVGSATHWQNVDEIPTTDATDYNYDNAAVGTNHYDLYNLTPTANVATVNAIVTWVRAQKDDTGTGNFRFVHKTQSTEYRDAADIALSQSWAYYKQIRETNPNTAVAWTASDLDALQAGFDAR